MCAPTDSALRTYRSSDRHVHRTHATVSPVAERVPLARNTHDIKIRRATCSGRRSRQTTIAPHQPQKSENGSARHAKTAASKLTQHPDRHHDRKPPTARCADLLTSGVNHAPHWSSSSTERKMTGANVKKIRVYSATHLSYVTSGAHPLVALENLAATATQHLIVQKSRERRQAKIHESKISPTRCETLATPL